jgi:hypothetical protein
MCADLSTDDDNCGACGNSCDTHAECVAGSCTCVAGYSNCGGTCTNTQYDADNCGSCGNACDAGAACIDGQCQAETTCEDVGLTTCGGTCVDTDSDADNCGACDNVCRQDQICSGGQCACPLGQTDCDGVCTNTNTDPDNCGSCGTSCGDDEWCAAGSCESSAQSCEDLGLTTCEVGGSQICADVDSDNEHCGACNNACDTGSGFYCQGGECLCGTGQTACDGACVNTNNDPANCGGCGNSCDIANGFACVAGECECTGGDTDCGDTCVDTDTDAANCGSCGNACAADERCVAGGCEPAEVSCEDLGLTTCGDVCVDTSTDNAHCGSCDNACDLANGFFCQGGQCLCGAGMDNCGDECTNTDNDPLNCGSCGNACEAGWFCVAGTCTQNSCADLGLTDCSGVCANLDTDNLNCGSCGNACDVANGFSCQGGECLCTGGETNCNNVCVDTDNDPDYCGGCNTSCAAGEFCVNGTCTSNSCEDLGLTTCGDICVDTDTDPDHCGGCDHVCTAGRDCQTGVCVCPAGQTYCAADDVCADLNSDYHHCGDCATACSGNEVCVDGSCVSGTIDHIEVSCDLYELPYGQSTQCHAFAYYAPGQGIAPQNITSSPDIVWSVVAGGDGILDIDAANGAVTVDSDPATTGSDMVQATYRQVHTGQPPQAITKVTAVLCDVKIVPRGEDWAAFDPDSDELNLPYLADDNQQLRWELFAVGEYYTDICGEGPAYYYEIRDEAANDWSSTLPAVATISEYEVGESGGYGVYLAEADVDPYPSDVMGLTVQLQHDDGTDIFSSLLNVRIHPLSGSDPFTWSLVAEPGSATLASGRTANFVANLVFGGGYTLNVTELPDKYTSWWPAATWTELQPAEDALLYDNGVVPPTGPSQEPEYQWQANLCGNDDPDPCTGDTQVEVSFQSAQADDNIRTDIIDFTINDAEILYCEVTPSDVTWPVGRGAVPYTCRAFLTNNTWDDITDQPIGTNWSLEYAGTQGALGFIEPAEAENPGLYHVPQTVPDPASGMIRYTFDPEAGEEGYCETMVTVAERTLCSIELQAADPETAPRALRAFFPAAAADGSIMLPNEDGFSQRFFVTGHYWNGVGEICSSGNTYPVPMNPDDITFLTTRGETTPADPIFPAITGGVGTSAASADTADRVDTIWATVDPALQACPAVAGCPEPDACCAAILANACGTATAGQDAKQIASTFTGSEVSFLPETTYAGDDSRRYHAIHSYDVPGSGCAFIAAESAVWWLEESEDVNWVSTDESVGEVDNNAGEKGDLYAVAQGTTVIGADWPGGFSPDATLDFDVGAAVVESIEIVPLGTAEAPIEVSYAGTPTISEKRQFVALASMSDGSTEDVTDSCTWYFQGGCDYLRFVAGSPNWVEATGSGEGGCSLMATFDPAGAAIDADAPSEVAAVQASVDCDNFFIQTPLRSCYDAPAADFSGYMIDADTFSTMNLKACIAFDNGTRFQRDLLEDDDQVTWVSLEPGVVSVADDGVATIRSDSGGAEILASFQLCQDDIIIRAGADTLDSVEVRTLADKNMGNCLASEVCLLNGQSVQFTVTGNFGANTMDLTTHSGTSFVTAAGFVADPVFPGFYLAPETAAEYLDALVEVDVATSTTPVEDDITVRIHNAVPDSLTLSVTDSTLDWSDYLLNSGGVAQFVAVAAVGDIDVDVTNDFQLIIPAPDDLYMRQGSRMTEHRGSAVNDNWFLVPQETGSQQTELGFDGGYDVIHCTAGGCDTTYFSADAPYSGMTVQP